MRKRAFFAASTPILAIAFSLLGFAAGPAAGAEGDWAAVRSIVDGYRDVSALVETTLTLVNVFKPKAGQKIHVTDGLTGRDFDELAVSLTSGSGEFAFTLEVWTKRGGTWSKAMEYSYDDASAGRIVIEPYEFDSVNYADGNMHRVGFQHASGTKTMSLHSEYSSNPYNVEKSIGTAKQSGGYVTIYFTAHLNISLSLPPPFDVGGAPDDAYLFGAKIVTASPHYCTAKQGVRDQGDTYDFTVYGVNLPINAGLFSSSDPDGFVSDGSSGGSGYPLASDIDAANLPDAADFTAPGAFPVSFQSASPPDFI